MIDYIRNKKKTFKQIIEKIKHNNISNKPDNTNYKHTKNIPIPEIHIFPERPFNKIKHFFIRDI